MINNPDPSLLLQNEDELILIDTDDSEENCLHDTPKSKKLKQLEVSHK